jgi:carboxypeptidase Q
LKSKKSVQVLGLVLSIGLVSSIFALSVAAKEPSKKAASASAAPVAPVVNYNVVDLDVVTQFRQEEFRSSKVMETLSSLTDSIGPRLTNSPNMRKANKWTRDQLKSWGLENSHLEAWGPFGTGWSYELATVRMIAPDTAELIALPKAWTPSTEGPVRGKLVRVKLENKDDLEKNKGKLAGAILLLGEMREVKMNTEAKTSRYTDQTLDELYRFAPQQARSAAAAAQFSEAAKRRAFAPELMKFLAEEKVAATIEPTRLPGDGGTVFVQASGSPYKKGEPIGVPALVMNIEHYGRIARLIDRNEDVEVEVNVKTKFYDDDPMGYNTVAEIPGSDLKDEVVMLGAHLDSWHGGTGATDNGAGSAVMMEAVRLIKSLDLHPRRTIRIALWSGEEQGLLGSRAYVAEHLATRPVRPSETNAGGGGGVDRRPPAGPLTFKPEYNKVSVYFNLDNGSGKIRGVYLQENSAAGPILQNWMEPFRDLGMSTLAWRNTGGTDHLSFDGVGVPGFQFIQDELEYDTRTHHSTMDTYERLQREDLMQASAVVASFVYNAAMRDQMFPRKPLAKSDIPVAAVAKTEEPAAKVGKKVSTKK